MDWVPLVFIAIKLGVFGPGMVLAIKWHYDQGKTRKKGGPRGFLAEIEREREVGGEVLLTGAGKNRD